MADIQEEIKNKVDDLLSRFKALSSRQKINLGIIVVVAIMVIISFFFIKSYIGKVSIDRSLIDSIQKERDALRADREGIAREREYFRDFIGQHEARDEAMVETIQRQSAYLNSMNQKLQSLDNAYKNLSRANALTSDELKKFFSELK